MSDSNKIYYSVEMIENKLFQINLSQHVHHGQSYISLCWRPDGKG